MKVAFGFKAHSGWAALVVIAVSNDSLDVLDRRRVELAHEEWAKQPYHAAEQLEPSEARKLVQRGIQAAQKYAKHEMSAAVKRAEMNGGRVVACGVLVGASMPNWSVDEILAVHFRMHKAEGVLFRETLADAATDCGLRTERIPEKQIMESAEKALNKSRAMLMRDIASLGKRAGPPWGKDQKEAALAAMIALQI
jgi:hypothetical protein